MNYIFLNGRFLQKTNKEIHSLRPGLIDAKGAFETIGVYQKRMLLLKEHLERFKRALKLYGMKCPYSSKVINQNLQRVLRQNKIDQGRIRLALWQDEQCTNVTIIAAKVKMPSVKKTAKGSSLIFSSHKRNPNRFSHIKSMRYGIFEKAAIEARQQGYEEALLLNDHQAIVEGSMSNIFIVKNNCLMTPPVKDGCLNGIVRQKVLSLARKNKIKCQVVSIFKRDLLKVQEVFLTNSFIGIMPVAKIQGVKRKFKTSGRISSCLIRAYQELVTFKK